MFFLASAEELNHGLGASLFQLLHGVLAYHHSNHARPDEMMLFSTYTVSRELCAAPRTSPLAFPGHQCHVQATPFRSKQMGFRED